MKKISEQYRQGDVLIEQITSISQKAKKQKGRVILAHGEATGHAHEIDMDAAESWKDGDSHEINVTKAAPVKHQEHGAIPLKRGVHRVLRQKEYSPAEIRTVAD